MAGLSCGIVGLPNVGKSTLFNALTASKAAEAANYPFCTIDPNVGVVPVVDERLDRLSELSKSQRVLYATTEFVDIAGLVEGASKGEGLGNAFLSHIRETDAIVQVVRCFESSDIIHVKGRVNPIEDIEIINLELILSDLASCESSIARIEKQVKTKKELVPVFEALQKVKAHLDESRPVRTLQLTDEEKEHLKPYRFLTSKKVLYVCNVSEQEVPHMENEYVRQVREYAQKEGNSIVPLCASLEYEISQLDPNDRKDFLESVGLKESGLQRLVKASFDLLGLMTFITTGEIETRAWTIPQGTPAVEAAGKIHSDIQRGFIRAEVISYDDFIACGGRARAKELGKARAEGKEYIMKDGDVVLFLHSS